MSAPRRTHRRLAALAAVLSAALPSGSAAKNGAFRESAHGNLQTGVLRVPGVPRGECAHCHGAPRDAAGRKDEGAGHARLFSLNDNGLCFGCHRTVSGSWLGDRRYDESAHGGSPAAVWPGPDPRARPAGDAGKCVNCHDPHGVKDAKGLVPRLLRLRGAALCLGCHAGNPGPDVASAFAKAYRHPLVADPPRDAAPAGVDARTATGTTGLDAPAGGTCAACHNPHAAAPDTGASRTATASRALLGVSRARVSNGVAGSPPVRDLAEARDTTAVREYEICFKCHASASGRLARGPDLGAALNPANASFHPVEAQGRSASIDRRAFTPGWSPDRLVTCSDCHSSDDEVTRGPHGSSYPWLLRRRHPTGRTPNAQVLEADLCFQCHAWRTYGDPFAGAERAYSRYPGHATHVARGATCWACHEAHGSATLPALLALRTPGLLAFAQDRGGGACTASCHVSTPTTMPYRVTYSR